MNTKTLARWESYWGAQTEPHHTSESDVFYDRHALELRALFAGRQPARVLEIGCGNGALYERLGFQHGQYQGVDFSQSMLDAFAELYPEAELQCSDGSAYCDDRQYDLIFSNGVIQYFDSAMLTRHFQHVRRMMAPAGVFVCASIPWKLQRGHYVTGELFPPYKPSLLRLGKALARFVLRRPDQLGNWYGFGDFERLAAAHGMVAEMFPSLCYVYRFHAAMKLSGA